MQFFAFTTILFAVASGVMAAPAPSAGAPESSHHLQARTCGTLTGKPLQLCQGACKAACVSPPPALSANTPRPRAALN